MKKYYKKNYSKVLKKNKKKLEKRLERKQYKEQEEPMLRGRNIRYEMAERSRGMNYGGIGAIHTFVRGLRLDKKINKDLNLLKRHVPYHESDHVLNLCYNILVGGRCIEDLELLRNDEVYMDALGAERIPDPTTERDFLRRFEEADDVLTLQECINERRKKIWRKRREEIGNMAIVDVDGTITETEGECKEGMDISYDGKWGYHPLLISLANTQEVIYLVNRSGNRPSHDGAGEWIDRVIDLLEGEFEEICLRGDTDFSLTGNFDKWTERGIGFCFGTDARPNLVRKAEGIDEREWKVLERDKEDSYERKKRKKPENVKERIIKQREFKNLRLESEHVSEFRYRPTKCEREYRVVVLRKNITVEKGEIALFDEIRYFFYITNREDLKTCEVIFFNNKRCNQEKLIGELKNEVKALRAPTGDLLSNWAFMVIAALAWNIKAWYALLVKHSSAREAIMKMGFQRFLRNFILIPVQIVKGGRELLYRFLNWNRWTEIFFETFETIRKLRFA